MREPLAIALQGLDPTACSIEGARCFVSGARQISLLAAVVLKLRGAASMAISLLQPRALDLTSSVVVKETFNIAHGEGPETLGYDVIVEAAGSAESLQAALGATLRADTVVQRIVLPRELYRSHFRSSVCES